MLTNLKNLKELETVNIYYKKPVDGYIKLTGVQAQTVYCWAIEQDKKSHRHSLKTASVHVESYNELIEILRECSADPRRDAWVKYFKHERALEKLLWGGLLVNVVLLIMVCYKTWG